MVEEYDVTLLCVVNTLGEAEVLIRETRHIVKVLQSVQIARRQIT